MTYWYDKRRSHLHERAGTSSAHKTHKKVAQRNMNPYNANLLAHILILDVLISTKTVTPLIALQPLT